MRILAYTPPSRGHLTPMMGPLLELRRRGAEVHVRTLGAAVDAVRAAGLEAAPIAPEIEAIALDDHKARSQITAGARTFATLRNRAGHEVADLEAALDAVARDVLLVDAATLGAQALAERCGLRWGRSAIAPSASSPAVSTASSTSPPSTPRVTPPACRRCGASPS